MPKLTPPPGMVARHTAVKILIREKVITSASMFSKLKGTNRVTLEGRSHGFYPVDRLLEIINSHRGVRGLPPLKNIFEGDHIIVFRQATPEDMFGVYEVARKLFGHTTSAAVRIPLVERCPEGNYVVTDYDQVVSYAHIQPLLTEPLKEFLAGKFWGSEITADYLDPFEAGKVVDILVKSLGTYHEDENIGKRYSKALFIGLRHELIKWGCQGYIIHRIYATSETRSGIEAAAEFQMKSLGKITGSKKKKRYAFELDPYTSNYPMMQDYRVALAQWKNQHFDEYKNAWREWDKEHSQEKE